MKKRQAAAKSITWLPFSMELAVFCGTGGQHLILLVLPHERPFVLCYRG